MVTACMLLMAALLAPPSGHDTLTPAQEEAMLAVVRGERAAWPGLDRSQLQRVRAKAQAYLDNFQRHHLPHGLSVDVLWTSPDRREVRGYDALDDGACWTGHYLAALALRHRETHDAAALAAILDALDRFDLLTQVTGRDGYLARYACPANDDDSAQRAKSPYTHLAWRGGSSRDTYDGAALAFAACVKYVDDGDVQARTRNLVRRIAGRLFDDNWNIVDGRGGSTPPTALWKLSWMRLAISADPVRFRRLRREYDELFSQVILSPLAWDIRRKDDDEYYLNHLAFVRFFVLHTLETEPDKRDAIKRAVTEAYDLVRDHLNAQLAAVYLLVTESKDDGALAALQGGLLDFPDPPRLLRPVDSRAVAGMADDHTRFADRALLPRDRPVADFLWRRSPCLAAGGEDIPREYPGIDVFLPYWMGRAAGVF